LVPENPVPPVVGCLTTGGMAYVLEIIGGGPAVLSSSQLFLCFLVNCEKRRDNRRHTSIKEVQFIDNSRHGSKVTARRTTSAQTRARQHVGKAASL
jgi:hypothetical protein